MDEGKIWKHLLTQPLTPVAVTAVAGPPSATGPHDQE